MFLDLGHDRGDGENDTEQHVEGDEELVSLALTNKLSGVVAVADNDGDQGEDVEDASDGQESIEPAGVIALLVVLSPALCPTVGKVNDENQLNDDEHEATNRSKTHQVGPKLF